MNISSDFINFKKLNLIMLLCIIGYASLKYSFRFYGDIFQTILILGFFYSLHLNREIIKHDAIFKVFIATLLVPILSWINATIKIPELANKTPDIGHIVNMFYFLPIAFFIHGKREKIFILWLSMAFGFLLSFISHSDGFFNELLMGFQGHRISFNINNAQHPAVWSGVAILVLCSILLRAFKSFNRNLSILICFIISLLILFFLFVLIATQTRQVLVAITISFIFSIIFYPILKNRSINIKKILLSISIVLMLITTISLTTNIEKRFESELNTISLVFSGNLSQVPDNSSGIRISLWRSAFDWVKERPLLGSDYGVSQDIINNSEKTSAIIKKTMHHLHSSIVDLTVFYGLIGLILILSSCILTVKRCFQRNQSDQFDEIEFCCLAFFIYWFIVNCFESYLFTSTGLLVHNIMLGSFFVFSAHLESKDV